MQAEYRRSGRGSERGPRYSWPRNVVRINRSDWRIETYLTRVSYDQKRGGELGALAHGSGPAPCRERQERYPRILAYPLKEWQTPPVGGIRLSITHPLQFQPSLMNSLFRGRGSEPPGRLEKELASLEAQAATASPGYETQFLNRAGNLCVEAGQSARALGYYGRAIDAYLESGRFSAAEVLCRKVLQIAPTAVRARGTLAWLALGKGFQANTSSEIAEYVEAAVLAGQEELAAKQLMMMAEAASDVDLREELAEHLLQLDEAEKADRVFGLVFEERNGLRPAPMADEGKLWAKLLRAALMGPKELHQQAWDHSEEDADALPSLTRSDRP
jgi:hypothetical protein